MPDSSPLAPLALVTGAARRLGDAIALGFSRQGYATGLHYHSSEVDAHRTATEIQAGGARVSLFQADLTKPEEIKRMFEFVAQETNPLRLMQQAGGVIINISDSGARKNWMSLPA